MFSPRVTRLLAASIVAAVIGGLFAFEPVTRNFFAQDIVCVYCHFPWEYDGLARLSASKIHPSSPVQGKCVDCHLPKGFWKATFAYAHFAQVSDLFGHFRDRDAERAGEWIPPRAAMAYRVRDRFMENDSVTCRSCHIEAEIKLRRIKGREAHKLALEEKKTCIECHYNLIHREVDLREDGPIKKVPPA